MKTIAIVILLALCTGTALAQSIYDIQTGAVAEGTLVTPRGVVVATRYNGFYVSEEPHGAYNGIWVFTGSTPTVAIGDDVQLCGVYEEYYGLSEVNIDAAGLYGSSLVMGQLPVPAPSVVTAADLMADPEPWESCQITIQDGMQVTVVPDSYGEWFADALDGTTIMFDDYWYDTALVMLGQCYNNATGILNYGFGAFKLEPYADGIPIVDCTVDTEEISFGAAKAMYR